MAFSKNNPLKKSKNFKKSNKFTNKSEIFGNSSKGFRMHPGVSEWVRMGPNTSKNFRKPSKTWKLKISKKKIRKVFKTCKNIEILRKKIKNHPDFQNVVEQVLSKEIDPEQAAFLIKEKLQIK